jgi:hypothetical protein
VYQKGQFNPIQVTQKEYEAYISWDNSHGNKQAQGQ